MGTHNVSFEPRCEKTGLWGFRPGPTQNRLYSHRRWLEAWNYGFRKKRDCTIRIAKAKALISCVVTVQLICVFVFTYAKSGFSHNEAHFMVSWQNFSWDYHQISSFLMTLSEPRYEKTWDFLQGPTQNGLYSHKWIEVWNDIGSRWIKLSL